MKKASTIILRRRMTNLGCGKKIIPHRAMLQLNWGVLVPIFGPRAGGAFNAFCAGPTPPFIQGATDMGPGLFFDSFPVYLLKVFRRPAPEQLSLFVDALNETHYGQNNRRSPAPVGSFPTTIQQHAKFSPVS